ncbi:MAG TPA: RNA polymerase sigma factor [Kofleriaceae bacterium]
MGVIARTDIELVEASLRGEHEAFGDLVARYQDVVCAVSYSSTGDQVLSEDVAQETFIAAWRQLARLRNSARLRPWLCGIARNLARTARKRRRREPLVDADEQVASGASPFDIAARGDVERVVREALARIPDAYREVLVLYYREDLSIREIAATLGVSEPTVMQRLSRGRRHLADSVTDVVERSLRGERRRRDLVAAVIASITAITLPSRVDASPTKGSTMLKFAIATSTVVAVGATALLLHSHYKDSTPVAAAKPAPKLQYGSGKLGLAHAPTLGPSFAPRAIVSRSVAEADLALLPADSEAVIGVNFAQLRQSALWQRFVGAKLINTDGVREFEALCGFNPLESLGSISLGVKGLADRDGLSGVMIIHGFERAKAMSCFDSRGVDEVVKAGTKVAVDGDVVLMTDSSNDHVAFTFIDDTTALVVIGPEAATKDGVLRIAAGTGGGLQSSTTFANALKVINTDDSLWVLLAESSPFMRMANTEIAPYTSIQLGTTYASLNVTDSLAFDAGLRLGSPEAVAKLVAEIQKRMNESDIAKQLSRHFDQLDVIADGSDLIVSLSLGGDQILQLVSSIMTSGVVSFN